MNKKLHSKKFTLKFIVLLLLLCSSHSLVNATIYDDLQQKEVSINMKNRLVKDLLNEIQKQTNLNFVYNENELSSYDQKSLNVKNQSVATVLTELFKGTNLTYKIVGNTITILKKEVKAEPKTKFSVSGKVIDSATKKPLAGTTVLVLGTTSGAITNADGLFEVKATTGDEIEFSFVGMISIKMVASPTNNKNLVIEMKADAVNVDDVVVTGIFNKSKESYTGAVSTITAKEIKMFSGQNLLSTLKNIDPAFNVRMNNDFGSDPNRLPEVNIRGNSSLPTSVKELNENAQAQLNAPLIIKDGFPISLQKLMDFNDEEIESITILKDASATAIYGSRGANGVVVITTKVPKEGKLGIYVQASTNIEMPDLSSYNLMNAAEKLETEKLVGFFSGVGSSIIAKDELYDKNLREVLRGVDTYWLSKPVQTGVGQKYNLRLEGGSKEFRWSTALLYNNVLGAMKGSDKTTFNGSINLAYSVGNVIFQNQTSIGTSKGVNSPYGSFKDYAKMNPYWRTHDENGLLIRSYKPNNGETAMANPLYNAQLNTKNTTNSNDIINNFSIEWNIFQGFKAVAKLGISKTNTRSDQFKPSTHTDFESYKPTDYLKKGSYSYSNGETIAIDANVTVSYSKLLAERHQIYAGLDYSISENSYENMNFLLEGFNHPNLNYLTNALKYKDTPPTGSEGKSRRLGVTGNFNYTYDNRYYFDLSVRMDGSSQFGAKNKFAPFWSSGIGWNLHREKFLKESRVINLFKIRGSYGQTGSQNFSSYQAISSYSYYNGDRYLLWNGAYLMGFGNENLKWQTTNKLNGGIELSFFNSRLTASVDVYHHKTIDLLSQRDLSPSVGFSSYTENTGSVVNKGGELMVSGYLIRSTAKELFWSATCKISHNKNVITSLSQAIKDQNQSYILSGSVNQLLYEGDSQNSIYVVPSYGIDPSTGNESFINRYGQYVDTWNAADRIWAGVSEPKFRGNISTMVSYKNLTINASFGMHWGGQQYNQTLIDRVEVPLSEMGANLDKRVLTERWRNPGDVKPFKRLTYSNVDKTKPSSRFVQDDCAFEFQSLSVNYKLTTDWLRNKLSIQTLTIGANMSDLFYLSTIKRERGLEYPFARRVSLSLSLMF